MYSSELEAHLSNKDVDYTKPLNEFRVLKNSIDFSWTKEANTSFQFIQIFTIIVIAIYFFWSILLLNSHFIEQIFNKQLLLICNLANISISIFLMRYYLGWHYVYNRLMKATVIYEESGWYDGQVWVKTTSILLQDRLIGTYEVLPILKKFKTILLFFIGGSVVGLILFQFIIK